MDKTPLISVITINFNDRVGLERTFESVFNQTFQDFEYIVIDGGSNDGSKELIEENTEKISYWISEPDKGIYNAMNKGISAAKGDYLLFLNSGDKFYAEKSLSLGSKYLGEEDIIYGDLEVVNDEKSSIKKYPTDLSLFYFYEEALPHPSTFIKKSAFEKFGLYDENLKIVSDWKWFLLSICTQNASFKKIEEVISTFYLDGMSSDLANQKKLANERNLVFETYFPKQKADLQKFRDLQNENKKLKEFQFKYNHLKKYRLVKLLDQFGLIKIPK
jgi:glycosyltransferase involved in cell wall biosynthesis